MRREKQDRQQREGNIKCAEEQAAEPGEREVKREAPRAVPAPEPAVENADLNAVEPPAAPLVVLESWRWLTCLSHAICKYMQGASAVHVVPGRVAF